MLNSSAKSNISLNGDRRSSEDNPRGELGICFWVYSKIGWPPFFFLVKDTRKFNDASVRINSIVARRCND